MSIAPDFQVTYHWSAGVLRPPYHYEYSIRVGADGQGQIAYLPDYPNRNPPQWEEKFQVDGKTLETLADLLAASQVFSGKVGLQSQNLMGGQQAWLEATSNGQHASVPVGLNAADAKKMAPVYDAMRALVPKATWDQLEARRQEFISGHTN